MPPVSDRSSPTAKTHGRPKVPYRRRKAYKTIHKLNAALESADRKRQKYKMRWLRLKQSHPVHHHRRSATSSLFVYTPFQNTLSATECKKVDFPACKKRVCFFTMSWWINSRMLRKPVHHKRVMQFLRTYSRSTDLQTLHVRSGCHGQLQSGNSLVTATQMLWTLLPRLWLSSSLKGMIIPDSPVGKKTNGNKKQGQETQAFAIGHNIKPP